MLMDEDSSKRTQATEHVPQAVKDAVFVQSACLPPYTPTVKGTVTRSLSDTVSPPNK